MGILQSITIFSVCIVWVVGRLVRVYACYAGMNARRTKRMTPPPSAAQTAFMSMVVVCACDGGGGGGGSTPNDDAFNS